MVEKPIVTVGCFDLLHHGHIRLFERMRVFGSRLHVLVHDDYSIFINKDKFPVQSIEHRIRNLRAIGLLEEVLCVANPDPTPALQEHHASIGDFIFVRGDDWPDFPGRKFLESVRIEIKLVSYTSDISSTRLRDQL